MSSAAGAASAGTAHQFLQSLQYDVQQQQHQPVHIHAQGADGDAEADTDADADADADASDPLLASLRMYKQYGEDSNLLPPPTASSSTVGILSGNAIANVGANTNNHRIQPSFVGDNNGALVSGGMASADDKLQQLLVIQAQLAHLERMERDLQAQQLLQQQQLQSDM